MIYDYPQYYELAFSFRDIDGEAEFLQRCIDRYSQTRVHSILEIACGHAPHASRLIKTGYNYIGLDINRNMLDYAHYKCKDIRPQPIFIEADMVNFQYAEQVEFAFVMLGSLYIRSADDMKSHFDSISSILKPGGLYFLDWCIQFTDPLTIAENNDYKIEKDGISIHSRFNIQLIDQQNQMYEEVWTLNVNDHGRHQTFNMTERNKAILPDEFLKFINARSDFEFVNWWRDWNFNRVVTDDDPIIRPVALVRKK